MKVGTLNKIIILEISKLDSLFSKLIFWKKYSLIFFSVNTDAHPNLFLYSMRGKQNEAMTKPVIFVQLFKLLFCDNYFELLQI